MSILGLVVFIIVGAVMWWIVSTAPLPPPFKWAITAIVLLILCGWLLNLVGAWPGGVRLR